MATTKRKDVALKKKSKKAALTTTTPATLARARRSMPTMTLKPNPKLEDLLVKDRADMESWQVYADWLLEQGEPWGEVIVEACRGKRRGEAKKRYGEVEALLEGIDGATFKWKNGVIDSLELTPEESPEEGEDDSRMARVLATLLRHPAGRLVRTLTLGLPPRNNINWTFDDVIEAIGSVGGPLPLLEILDLTPDAEHMDQESWRRVGDLRPLWKAAPRLRELHLRGSNVGGARKSAPIRFGNAIDAPRLEMLIFVSSGLDKAAPMELGSASLPSLKHLELYFGSVDYGNNCTMKSLAKLLEGKGLPKLETLGLVNSPWEAELIEAIATAPLLRRIKHLDLSKGVLFTEGPDALLRLASKFVHLASIDLDDNFIPDEYKGRFKKTLPKAKFGSQRFPERDFRFTSVGE